MGSIVDISEVLLPLGLSNSVTEEERGIVSAAIVWAEGAAKRFLKYDPVQRTRTEYYPQQNFEEALVRGVWDVDDTSAFIKSNSASTSNDLQVQHIPIRSVATLAIDYDGRNGTASDAFPTSSEKTEGTDFWPNYDGADKDGNKMCKDGIIKNIGSWPTTPGSVKLVYTAGYTDDELHGQGGVVDASPITFAVLSESLRRAKKALVWKKTNAGYMAGPLVSEKLGDYSYRTDPKLAYTMFGGLWGLLPESTSYLESFVNWGWGY